jgi:hypothetical protein
MEQPRETSHETTRDRIRRVLLEDWDPHDVTRNEHARGSYDHYIPALDDLLKSGASEDDVVFWLREREQETMCFPSIGLQRLRPVARKLLAAVKA